MSEFLTLTELSKHGESYYKPLIDDFNEGLNFMSAELHVQSAMLSVNVKYEEMGGGVGGKSHWRKLTLPGGTGIKIVKASYTAKGLGFWIHITHDPYNCHGNAIKKMPPGATLYGYHVMYPALFKCVEDGLEDILEAIHQKGVRVRKPTKEKVMEFVETELPEWGSW